MKREKEKNIIIINSIIHVTFLLCVLLRSAEAQTECGIGQYNFSSLTKTSNFYSATTDYDTYYFNICGYVTTEYCTSKPFCGNCQVSGGSQSSCGQYNSETTFQIISEGNISMTYYGGDICTGQPNQPSRMTTFFLICDQETNFEVTVQSCAYTITFRTPVACPPSSLTVTPSPSPSPSKYSSPSVGNSPCNPIKVDIFPSSFHGNLAKGSSFNGSCMLGRSVSSQFYYIYPPFNGNLTISTCNAFTFFDSEIALYSGDSCNQITCVASNDDGCGSSTPTSSYLIVPVTQNTKYYLEVRAFGEPTNINSIYQIIFDLTY